jgi:chromosome segregation ATPase
MPPTVDVTRKYTVSELRTLRTAYAKALDNTRQILDPLVRRRDTLSSEIKQATNPSEREKGRLAGVAEAVAIVQNHYNGLNEIMQRLNDQYREVPKYKSRKQKEKAAGKPVA